MQQQGKITDWNTLKGFGFITPDTGEKRVFIHIKNLQDRTILPKVNQRIIYKLSKDKHGRTCAIKASRPDEVSTQKINRPILPTTILIIFSLFLITAIYLKQIPFEILIYYFFFSSVTFFIYYIDKSAAKNKQRRISENTLHLLSIFGGWPGAIFAQKMLHHKSKKLSFRITFFVTILLNISGFFLFFINGFNSFINLVETINLS